MSKVRYTTEHEWLRAEADGAITVGITAYAQEQLGDVVYVQLPELQRYAKGDEVAVLESVKAASNIVMPIDGEIIAINDALEANPEVIGEDAENAGWFFRIRPDDAAALDSLLDRAAYDALIADVH